MHRIEKFAITSVLTANLLTAPYGDIVASDTLPQAEHVEMQPDGTQISVLDLSRVALAATLPPEIDIAARSVVAIAGPTGRGSGVKIASDRILTAGHMLIKEDTDQLDANNQDFNCDSTVVEASLGSSDNSEAISVQAVQASDIKTKTAPPDVWGTDYASLWIDTASPVADQMPSVSVTYPRYAVGKEIFFANYEPSADHQRRSPFNEDTVSPEDNFHDPAIYGGIVIKDMGKHLLVIDDIDRNYGKGHPETASRGGSSGGPGFVDGTYAGMMVAGPTKRQNAAEIEQKYHVRLTGSIPNMTHDSYTVGFVQKTTPDMLSVGTTGGMPPATGCAPQRLPMTIDGTRLTIN